MDAEHAPPFPSPPGGALILGNKDDLAGQFSRLVGRGSSFMAPDQSPLAMAQLQARADRSFERQTLALPPDTASPDQVHQDASRRPLSPGAA